MKINDEVLVVNDLSLMVSVEKAKFAGLLPDSDTHCLVRFWNHKKTFDEHKSVVPRRQVVLNTPEAMDALASIHLRLQETAKQVTALYNECMAISAAVGEHDTLETA